ncbi:carbohydrate ABC transporter permease (plasmid) [Rossellomorea sp. FS2]|uniref:carbohydrate ABC transporter permease n=1 Tax=Rossellomorea sp. FS2 TaxID=3391447 RepID=UPI003A4D5655
MQLKPKVKTSAIYVAASLISLFYILPLAWMVILSTNTREDVYKFPPPITFGSATGDNLQRLLEGIPFIKALWNSFYVSGLQTLLVLLVSSLTAYALSKYTRVRGRKLVLGIIIGSIMIPPLAGLIPWFIVIKNLGWLDTHWGLIIPPAANAFGVFWLYQFIDRAIPKEIYEAAKVDGASDLRTFSSIVLPLIRPGLAALGILTFLNAWQNFQTPLLLLNDENLFTLPLALTNLSTLYATDVSAVMLGTTISIIPLLIAFLLMMKHFIEGLTNGSVK